jgi:hypothetical protein
MSACWRTDYTSAAPDGAMQSPEWILIRPRMKQSFPSPWKYFAKFTSTGRAPLKRPLLRAVRVGGCYLQTLHLPRSMDTTILVLLPWALAEICRHQDCCCSSSAWRYIIASSGIPLDINPDKRILRARPACTARSSASQIHKRTMRLWIWGVEDNPHPFANARRSSTDATYVNASAPTGRSGSWDSTLICLARTMGWVLEGGNP